MGRYTQLSMIFDSASDWLVAESIRCENCEGNKFDPRSYGVKVEPDEEQERSYGDVYLTGKVWKDTICLHFSQCVNDFQYFAIEYQEGLREPIDGIMGLAKNVDTFHLGESSGISTTKSYVTALKEEGLIDKE